MASRNDEFDGEPEAFEPGPDGGSVVDAARPFNAEVGKRKSTRALVVGALVLVVLIGLLAVGALMLKGYRQRWAADREEKAQQDREKMTMSRRGREFALVPKPSEEPAAIPAQAAAAPAAAIPLKATPDTSPKTSPAPVAKPPPPAMMVAQTGGAAQSGPTGTADNQPGAHAPLNVARTTVQQFADRETGGKAPTVTPQSAAAQLGDRSFVLARGSWIPCILETQLDTTVPGNASCVIPEDVYSDDGKALLIEKGSKAVGAFGNSLKRGDQRIAVTWERVRTPQGVVIDVNSPATDGVGTTGAGGYIDNHWLDRIGAAVLLSFVEDAIQYALQSEQNQGSAQGAGTAVYVPQNTANQSRRLAEKILDSTINIPPTLYKNRGDRVMIFVNRDLWFDSTYKLTKAY